MLALYAWTDQRDVQFWDVGEMQTVPWIYGIAHPTGFPLYVALGWVFSHLVPVGSVAWRMSLFSSLAIVATGGIVYLLVRAETGRPWIAVASAYLFDATSIAWSRGTRADVHPLAACLAAASVYAIFRYRRTSRDAWFVASLGFFGAALAVHPVALFAIVAPIAAVLPVARSIGGATWGRAALAFVVPLLSYALVPIRSAIVSAQGRDPTLALGRPAGGPFWDYAHTSDLRNLWWYLSGAQFHREAGLGGYSHLATLLSTLRAGAALARHEYGFVPLALALAGLYVLARRSPSRATALALLAIAAVPFAFSYVEEADKQRYLLIPLFALACLIGLGADGIARAFSARVVAGRPKAIEAAVAIALACIAMQTFYANRNVIAVDRDTVARRYVDDVERLTPDGAVVVADWVYATPLAYAAYVERGFGRRIVVASAIADALPDATRWARTRCVAYASESSKPSALGVRLHAERRNARLPYLFTFGACGR